MESIGEILREARHNKKASLEDAARATKIKLEILEQLESDEFDRLAAPTYTKGFLKLYSEYLGLDSQFIVDAYVRSQGGLRRQGLQMETEKSVRARQSRELKLPLGSVARVVGALTIAVVLVVLISSWWLRRGEKIAEVPAATPAAKAEQPAPTPVTAKAPAVPQADFDAYYQPQQKLPPALLEASPVK